MSYCMCKYCLSTNEMDTFSKTHIPGCLFTFSFGHRKALIQCSLNTNTNNNSTNTVLRVAINLGEWVGDVTPFILQE